MRCLLFEQLTINGVSTLANRPAGTRFARIQAEVQAARMRLDGSAPDGNTGEIIPVNSVVTLDSQLGSAKFIEDVGGSKLNVHYYGD